MSVPRRHTRGCTNREEVEDMRVLRILGQLDDVWVKIGVEVAYSHYP